MSNTAFRPQGSMATATPFQRFKQEAEIQIKGLNEQVRFLENAIINVAKKSIQKSDFEVINGFQFEYHHKASKILKDIESYKDSDFFYSSDNALSADEQARYFNEAEQAIKASLKIVHFLSSMPQQKFASLPLPAQSSIVEALSALQDIFFKMQSFTRNPSAHRKGESSEEYQSWLKSHKELLEDFHRVYLNLTSFCAPLYFSEHDNVHERLDDIERVITEYANAAAKEAVGKFDILYAQLSSKFAESAKNWLYATFGMAIVSVIIALCTVVKIEKFSLSILGDTLHTAFILAMLSALTIWCGRNYAINRHNELINKHKELSLTTFSQFVNAAGADNELRKVIVERTTSAIFDSSPSGYLKMGKNESSGEFPSVLNILNPKSAQSNG